MKIQVIKGKIKAAIKKETSPESLKEYFIAFFVFGMLFFVIPTSFYMLSDYVKSRGAETAVKDAIQEAGSYDALKSREITRDYQILVLDNVGEKNICYHVKGTHEYYYYRVKPDLSVEEVPVTETAFPSDQCNRE